ncbi:MAG: site-specific integrase [Desulfobacteraceae bacterium]|nr:MAG: site-specific integrase [Desulfobacteraceae bacterium]
MGMVYLRGKTYWIKYYRNGKPFYESSKSKTETVALRLLKRREGEISQGQLPGVFFDRVKFEDLKDDLVSEYKLNGRKSLDSLEFRLQHLTEFFGKMKVPQVISRIDRYVLHRRNSACMVCYEEFEKQDTCPACGSDKVKAGASNATINRELAALKRMLNLGARQTPPKVDRVPHIPMLKENNIRKGFFEHQDYITLLKALPAYIRPVVTFGYKTGWRKSEIIGLTWDRVDREKRIARLEPGESKNGEARTVYLDDELLKLIKIQWMRRNEKEPYVFLRDGEQIKDFRGAWEAGCKDAGMEDRLFHDLRRTAVRNMVRSGIPERVAMTISGHKTRAVFDRYNIVSMDDLKAAATKQEAYLNGMGD